MKYHRENLETELKNQASTTEQLHKDELEALKLAQSQETKKFKASHAQEIANMDTKHQELTRFSEQQGHKMLGLE
jgi:hypothetical protein